MNEIVVFKRENISFIFNAGKVPENVELCYTHLTKRVLLFFFNSVITFIMAKKFHGTLIPDHSYHFLIAHIAYRRVSPTQNYLTRFAKTHPPNNSFS